MDLEDIYACVAWLQAKTQPEEILMFVPTECNNRLALESKWLGAVIINQNVGKIKEWLEEM